MHHSDDAQRAEEKQEAIHELEPTDEIPDEEADRPDESAPLFRYSVLGLSPNQQHRRHVDQKLASRRGQTVVRRKIKKREQSAKATQKPAISPAWAWGVLAFVLLFIVWTAYQWLSIEKVIVNR